MVAIGSCDICGEFCASEEDDFATAEYHLRLAERLHDCNEWHFGPWHDAKGRPLSHCDWCADLSEYFGNDNSLEHSDCARCQAERPLLLRPAPRGWTKRQPLQLQPRIGVVDPRGLVQNGLDHKLEDDWYAGLESTEPADRARVEHALRTYFGQKRVRIRWYDSPPELGQAFAEAVQAGGLEPPLPPAELEPWSFWSMAPAALRERVADPYVLDSRYTATRLVDQCQRRAQAIASAVEDLARPEDTAIWPPFAASGQFDVVSRHQDVVDGLPGATPIPDGGLLRLMAELRVSAGPALIFDGQVHILDRPLAMRLDSEARLHCEEGPAIAYRDGSTVWALHGVVLPRDVVLHPELISAEDVERQANAEVRRVLIELFGPERLVREAGAELVAQDEAGRLWRWSSTQATRLRQEPVVMVEVINSTPEPDGTCRTYYLRVPPEVESAREAVAWTFGLSGPGYAPVVET